MVHKGTFDSYGKGSVLPSIVDAEHELRKLEESARQRAAEMLEEAKRYRERKIEETRRRLPALEAAERTALLESVDERVEEIQRVEEDQLRQLESTITSNRGRAVAMIVREVAPSWSGRFPGEEKQDGK